MKKTNKPGQPTLYKVEYNEQVYKLCLLGATDKNIASFFDVDVSTINNWKLAHPKFFDSIKSGKIHADMEVANSLYKGASDRVITTLIPIKLKEVSWENGNKIEKERIEMVEETKIIQGDFRNQQFWLRNRKAESWKEKTEVEQKNIDITWVEETINKDDNK